MIDTEGMMFPKSVRPKKEKKGLKSKTRLKSHSKPKNKTQIDMSFLEVPKKIRIEDSTAKDKVKSLICEVCGKPSYGDPHHIKTVGSGGPDIEENQIQLCWECHYVKVPSGKLTKRFLFSIVAKRMRVDTEDLIEGVKQLCV